MNVNVNGIRLVPILLCAINTTLLLSIGTSAVGQFNDLKGTWINPDMQAIVISDTITKENNNYLSTKRHTRSFQLRSYGDTLSFQNHYTSSATNFSKLHIDRYDFKIAQADLHTLVLNPVSKFASDYFGSGKQIVLKKQEYTTDSTIRFEKLVFSSGLCYGECPNYEYELTNKGIFQLHVKTAFLKGNRYMRDSTARGYFVGQVTDSLYRAVIDALQTCYLPQLTISEVLCCDAPLKTVSVYFNGQERKFKTMFPPIIVHKLFTVLQTVYDESPRKRTVGPFVFEQSKR